MTNKKKKSPLIIAVVAAAAIGVCVAACGAEGKRDDVGAAFDKLPTIDATESVYDSITDTMWLEPENISSYEEISSEETIETDIVTLPETIESPETTQNPETTRAPEITRAPETTKTPETTCAPETTKVPETTRAPETAKAPEIQEIPETLAAIVVKRSDSSMTSELVSELENIAVFWAPTGKKMHLDPDCTSFKLGITFAGTLEEAKSVREDGWCGICSKGMMDEKYSSNANATAERLADCYTYEDYINKIPAEVFK